MMVAIQRTREILTELARLDPQLKAFGADTHRYTLGPPLDARELADFEDRQGITLPDDFRAFVTTIGNGGAGPGHGLLPLHLATFAEENPQPLGAPFPHSHPWGAFRNRDGSMDGPGADLFSEEEYHALRWLAGSFYLAAEGGGVGLLLVVSGPEKGNIWVDDRQGEAGIHPYATRSRPGRMQFQPWYELWLGARIEAARRNPTR